MTVNFETLDERRTVCFVNSETQPDKVKRFNVFKHNGSLDLQLMRFFQLVQNTYEHSQNGMSINYSLLDWNEVHVKSHCKRAFANMIDGMDAVEEFIRV